MDAPVLTFFSIYHVTHNRLPYKQIIEDYSYKPNMNCQEALISLKEDLLRLVERFRQTSKKEGKITI